MTENEAVGVPFRPDLDEITGWLCPPSQPSDEAYGSLEIWREGDDHYAIVIDGTGDDGWIGSGRTFAEAAENAYLLWRRF